MPLATTEICVDGYPCKDADQTPEQYDTLSTVFYPYSFPFIYFYVLLYNKNFSNFTFLRLSII